MNRRTYRRALAPVILAIAILAGTVGQAGADSGPGYHNPGQSFSGGCSFSANWNNSNGTNPPNGFFGIFNWTGTPCNNVWKIKILCGVYPQSGGYYWITSQYFTHTNFTGIHHYGIGNYFVGQPPSATCLSPSADILNVVFVVSTGPYSTACSNANGGVYDFFIMARTDVPCAF